MANRAIQAKVEKSAKESRELYAYDYLKYEGAKITSAELSRMCEGVKVQRLTTKKKVVSRLVYDRKVHEVTRLVSVNVGKWNARTWNKRAGTCERRLWIGKPPRI